MFKRTIIILIFLSAITIAVLFFYGKIWFVYPDRDLYPIRGIDVSHHQGEIDWSKVANDDVGFAYIKATEANDFKDNLFNFNLDNALKNNISAGAYHFYSLAYSGEDQANNFIETVPLDRDLLPPAIDLEYVGNSKKRPTKEQFQNDLKIYIDKISSKYGKQPILYTTYEFYDDYLYPEFKNYKIWIRDIFSKPNSEKKNNWVIWQYNSFGRVDGISGSVDLNVINPQSSFKF